MIRRPEGKASVRIQDRLAHQARRPDCPRGQQQGHARGHPCQFFRPDPRQGERHVQQQVRLRQHCHPQSHPRRQPNQTRSLPVHAHEQIYRQRHDERQSRILLQHTIMPDVVWVDRRIERRGQPYQRAKQKLADSIGQAAGACAQ